MEKLREMVILKHLFYIIIPFYTHTRKPASEINFA